MATKAPQPLRASPMPVFTWFTTFVRSQWTRLPYPDYDFSGETVIVTGANTGIGFEAAKHLARLNAAKIILAVRTVSKGETARERIIQDLKLTGEQIERIEIWQLDLGDFQSVLRFGERAATLGRLDAVLQNAGILTRVWTMVEGMESQIAVDVVGPILLGLVVLPTLCRSAKAHNTTGRLSFVGSDAAYMANISEFQKYPNGPIFDALNDQAVADMEPPLGRYSVAKLLLWYAMRWLASIYSYSGSNVIINIQTPGACKSDMFRDDYTWLERKGKSLMDSLFARTAEVGSRTMVHAVHPGLDPAVHGGYLQDCKLSVNGPNIDSPAGKHLAEHFVKELVLKLEAIKPDITQPIL